MINDGYKKVMYSGVLWDIVHNTQDGKIEQILVKQCYMYKFLDENDCSKYDKKYIPGNIMCFSRENIINFNLTHVTRDKNYKNVKSFFHSIATISFFVALLYVSISPWMENMFVEINGIFKKIIFSITSIMLISLIYGGISDLFVKKTKEETQKSSENSKSETEFSLGAFTLFSLFLLAPLLWTMEVFVWWAVILIWFILFCISLFISYKNNQ